MELNNGKDIYNLCEKLWPITRSITGSGVRETLGITDRAYIMNEGKILVDGTPDFIINNELAKKVYLGDQFIL